MKVIIYPFEGVNIVVPSPEFMNSMQGDEVSRLHTLAAKDVPSGIAYKIVDQAALPTDRTFRNAWECDADFKVTVSLDKAKEITKRILRHLRKPKFALLDADFMKALETSSSTSQIAADKQVLRDLPEKADTSKTISVLKSMIDALML